jgi:hypothetical protein
MAQARRRLAVEMGSSLSSQKTTSHEEEEDDDDDEQIDNIKKPSSKSELKRRKRSGVPAINQSMPIVVPGHAPFPSGFSKSDEPPPIPVEENDEESDGEPDAKDAQLAKRCSSRQSSGGVSVPSFRSISRPSDNKTTMVTGPTSSKKKLKLQNQTTSSSSTSLRWERPSSLIEEPTQADPSTLTKRSELKSFAYDADDYDQIFFSKWKEENPSSNLKIEELEFAMEVLERECSYAEANAEMNRNDIDLQCRNAATLAKGEHLLLILKSGKLHPGMDELTKIAEKASKAKKASLENSKNATQTIEILVPASILARAMHKPVKDPTVQAIHQYWIGRRKQEGGPLVSIVFLRSHARDATLDDTSPEIVAKVYSRLRELREDLERVRLVADSARKREKLKKEILKLSSGV